MDEINMLSGARIKGFPLYSKEGEKLGEIRDIMIDSKTGCIAYAVVDLEHVDGVEDRYCAVPWEALQANLQESHFTMDIEKERFQQGPAFDKDKIPTSHASSYLARVHAHYGFEPYWQKEKMEYH